MSTSIAIVGAGRVGTALGRLLRERGYEVTGVVCRTPERAEAAVRLIGGGRPSTDPAEGAKGAKVVFVTVPDRALAEVAAQIGARRRLRRGEFLVHTSGAHPAGVLRQAGTERAHLLSLHPLQTIADPSEAGRLVGAVWGLEGDEEALPLGTELVGALEGTAIPIPPGAKPLYHAAATVASNYAVALAGVALNLFKSAGLPHPEALKAVAALVEGAAGNLRRLGVHWALTGPVERGDVGTVRAHLEAIARGGEGRGPDAGDDEARLRIEGIYRVLGLEALRLVAERDGGLSLPHQGIKELLEGVS